MRFRTRARRRVSAEINLTPLIDVVFLLLLFFMLTSTFVVQSSIQIEIPKAQGATKLEQKDLTVTVAYGDGGPDGAGRIFVESVEMTSMEELTSVLREKVTDNPNLVVLVRSDGRASVARALEVLGIATSVGIERFSILAAPDEEP